MILTVKKAGRSRVSGITIVEAMMAIVIGGLMMAGVTNGFITAMRQAEWSSYSLAANSLALQKLEQTRSAKWDRFAATPTDEVVSSNFPPDIQVLDVPISKTNVLYATNFTSISVISSNPPLKLIRVDCVWKFMSRGLFTNTVATYRAPFQ